MEYLSLCFALSPRSPASLEKSMAPLNPRGSSVASAVLRPTARPLLLRGPHPEGHPFLSTPAGQACPPLPTFSSKPSPLRHPGVLFWWHCVFHWVGSDLLLLVVYRQAIRVHSVQSKYNTGISLSRELSWLKHRPDMPRSWVRSPVRAHTRIKQ